MVYGVTVNIRGQDNGPTNELHDSTDFVLGTINIKTRCEMWA